MSTPKSKNLNEKIKPPQVISKERVSDFGEVYTSEKEVNDMLNLVPKNLYLSIELLDLNKKLKFEDESFDAVICVGTFTFGHVKAKALGEFLRILKKNGLICFTINEGIFKEYKFDIKINDLTEQNDWEIIKFLKTSYIIKKEVESWICLARKK